MTIQDFLLWASPVLVPLAGGLLGTALEKLGTHYKIAALVGIGQRVEALFADIPKLIRGSRINNPAAALAAAVQTGAVVAIGDDKFQAPPGSADRLPKDDDGPPTPRTGAGAAPIVALLFAGSLALSGALPACASSPPPKGCTEQDAAKVAAICAARVQTECVDKGVAEADCEVIAECDAQADAYQKDCSR
jgi:hypothetical protein